eukprot:XP_011420973.1 PREDICTED: discoidin, CUB and LCCL domain-containing protein 2 [Crassostrea gigas]
MIPVNQAFCFIVWFITGISLEKVLACSVYMVDRVTDDKLTASSIYGSSYTANKARLSSNGWSPDASKSNPWIQVDFGEPISIMAVVTMGLADTALVEFVKKYMVKYSNTASTWSPVLHGTTNEFIANSDQTTAVTNVLPSPVVARYLRLYPTACNAYCSLRFDVIGCEVPSTTTSATTTPVQTTTTPVQTTTTPVQPIITTTDAPSTTTTSPASPTETSISTPLVSTVTNSTQSGLCPCACTQTNFSRTQQELQERIDDIVQKLTVPIRTTSKYVRSKTSAHDSRPGAVYVGSIGIAILCVFSGFIVLPDLFTVLRYFYSTMESKCNVNIFKKCKSFKNYV